MTATASERFTDGEVEAYLAQVAARLEGLPEGERAELLDDLAQHLAEVVAEPGPPLRERLGSPEAYAAELLASAGVPVAPGAGRLQSRIRALARPSWLTSVRASWRSSVVGREVSALRPVLQPAWWVARAYLAVSLLAALSLGGDYPGFPLPRLLGSGALGLLAMGPALALSVRLGRAPLSPMGRRAAQAGTVVLVVFGAMLFERAGTPQVRYEAGGPTELSSDGCLSDGSGRRITNLYAFDTDGRLLDPVLLYDQAGRPIDNLCPQYDERGRRLNTEYRRDVNGAPVINAFPRAQTVERSPREGDAALGESHRLGPAPEPSFVPVRPPAVVVPRVDTSATTPSTVPSSTVPSSTVPSSTVLPEPTTVPEPSTTAVP